MPNSGTDLIDKRVENAGKIFGWIKENPLAFLCTFLTFTNIVFIWLYISANDEVKYVSNDLNKQIQDEIRNQLPTEVKRQVEPIKTGVEKAASQMDTIINSIKK